MTVDEPVACTECGHLHYLGDGCYVPCPVRGCDCDPVASGHPAQRSPV